MPFCRELSKAATSPAPRDMIKIEAIGKRTNDREKGSDCLTFRYLMAGGADIVRSDGDNLRTAMYHNDISLAAMAEALSRSADFRVLRAWCRASRRRRSPGKKPGSAFSSTPRRPVWTTRETRSSNSEW